MLTRTGHYALSGMLRLALLPPGEYCRLEDLVVGTTAPVSWVAKVFQQLARHGMLQSVRGAHGGFRLAPEALDMPLSRILEVVEGPLATKPLETSGLCLEGQECPLSILLAPAFEQRNTLLSRTTLRDLVAIARSSSAPVQCCKAGCSGKTTKLDKPKATRKKRSGGRI